MQRRLSTNDKVSLYILGKKYEVPSTLTIQKAMEYAGYRFLRNCGCRGGVCGACLTIYRIRGDYRLYNVLACQASVVPGMEITQIPFFPLRKAIYDIQNIGNMLEALRIHYPEVFRCLSCNTCTKSCPQDIIVMKSIQAAIKGDFKKASEISFPCVMCGACAARCPAEISPQNVTLFVRRLYVTNTLSIPGNVLSRIGEITQGKFDLLLDELVKLDLTILKEIYINREQEPLEAGRWEPQEKYFPANLLVQKYDIEKEN
jgi:Fe-S oxidoreductase